jgi:large subunit ribosomal protein L23
MAADITDIKAILYTDKTFSLQEDGVVVVRTTSRMSKNSLKEIFRNYFGFVPTKVNSLSQQGKAKKFKGISGKQNDFKKFYVWIPEGAKIKGLEV